MIHHLNIKPLTSLKSGLDSLSSPATTYSRGSHWRYSMSWGGAGTKREAAILSLTSMVRRQKSRSSSGGISPASVDSLSWRAPSRRSTGSGIYGLGLGSSWPRGLAMQRYLNAVVYHGLPPRQPLVVVSSRLLQLTPESSRSGWFMPGTTMPPEKPSEPRSTNPAPRIGSASLRHRTRTGESYTSPREIRASPSE